MSYYKSSSGRNYVKQKIRRSQRTHPSGKDSFNAHPWKDISHHPFQRRTSNRHSAHNTTHPHQPPPPQRNPAQHEPHQHPGTHSLTVAISPHQIQVGHPSHPTQSKLPPSIPPPSTNPTPAQTHPTHPGASKKTTSSPDQQNSPTTTGIANSQFHSYGISSKTTSRLDCPFERRKRRPWARVARRRVSEGDGMILLRRDIIGMRVSMARVVLGLDLVGSALGLRFDRRQSQGVV